VVEKAIETLLRSLVHDLVSANEGMPSEEESASERRKDEEEKSHIFDQFQILDAL
jgi:hypothetical protein